MLCCASQRSVASRSSSHQATASAASAPAEHKVSNFLRQIIEEDVTEGLTPLGGNAQWPWSRVSGASDGRVTYIYLGEHQPDQWTSGLPRDDGDYQVDVIDTWNMTVTPAEIIPALVPHPVRHGGVVRGGKPEAAFGVTLPGRPYLCIRVREGNGNR